MALDPALSGRTFAALAPYHVSREKIAEFNAAIGADPTVDPDTAPYVFPMVVAFALTTQLINDPSVGIDLRNVVHRDERIDQMRPVRAGDQLIGTLTVDSVRTAAGVDLIATRSEIATTDGAPICTATAMLVHRGGGA